MTYANHRRCVHVQYVCVCAMYRKLMALPMLPAEQIQEAFTATTANIRHDVDARVQHVVRYVADTWVNSRLWPPHCWSVFRETIRTNNDVEGWHHRLNSRARRGNLDLYQLAPMLHTEARFVELQVTLVSEGRLRRHQRRRYTRLQGRLDRYWTEYENGATSTSKLLRRCSHIYAPNV